MYWKGHFSLIFPGNVWKYGPYLHISNNSICMEICTFFPVYMNTKCNKNLRGRRYFALIWHGITLFLTHISMI